jgi:2-polyprenyl-3-methyl-5-hydroxy-6-metoxy-1,4-benzoquinol methylase
LEIYDFELFHLEKVMASAPFDYEGGIPAGYYDAIHSRGRGIQSAWHQHKFRFVARHLPRTGSRLVDLGCGPGTFSQYVPKHYEYLGLDVSTRQIEYARCAYQRSGVQFNVIMPDDWGVGPGSIDVVSSIELVEHLTSEQCDALLTQAWQALRPGGQLLLTTPNYGSLWPILEKIVNRISDVSYQDQHITRFTVAKLRTRLANNGFVSIHVRSFQYAAPFCAAISWTLSQAMGRVEGALPRLPGGFLLFGSAARPMD